MLTNLTKTAATFATIFIALVALPACDSGDEGPLVQQSVEADVDAETFDLLVEAAEVDLEYDDFRIYEEAQAQQSTDEWLPTCQEEGEPEIWDHVCGYCTCDAQGHVICIDLICDPQNKVTEGEQAYPPAPEPHTTTIDASF